MDQDRLSPGWPFAPAMVHQGAYCFCSGPGWYPKLITYNNLHLSNTFLKRATAMAQCNPLCWQLPKILHQGTDLKSYYCGRWKKKQEVP